MARVTIEKAEVTSVMATGSGFRMQTVYKKRDGGEITEKWVVWSRDKVSVGDVVTVEGLFSKKDEMFTNDEGKEIKYVALHVNDPTVHQQPKGAPGENSSYPDQRSLQNEFAIDMEAPF